MGGSANVRGSEFGVQGSGRLDASRGPLAAGRSRGFTLVEMLVVIVIIGILASLITGAAIMARHRVRRGMVRTEIAQLEMALTHYKQEVGEFPPDFANVGNPIWLQANHAQNAVLRHLRRRFPRYSPRGNLDTPAATPTPWLRLRYDILHGENSHPNSAPVAENGYPLVDINHFGAASGLVFWLGGFPETAAEGNRRPAGFHADRQFPFKQGLPRTEPMFSFDPARFEMDATVPFGFYANSDPATRPYIYFRAERLINAAGQYEYGYVYNNAFCPLSYPAYNANNIAQDYAVPYLDQPLNTYADAPNPAGLNPAQPLRTWRNPDTFQILFAGFDNVFGNNQANFRFSRIGQQLPRVIDANTGQALSEGDFDNLTNFTDDTIEAEMQR